MLGLLYKDMRANLKGILVMLLVLIFLNGLTTVMLFVGEDNDSAMNTTFIMGFCSIMAVSSFMTIGATALNIVQTDERKKWGYYITAVPNGIRKQVGAIYTFVFIAMLITFTVVYGVNFIARTVVDAVPDMLGITLTLVFFGLIMRAIELPCIIAFGSKVGSQVKGGLMLLVILGIVVYLLFGDLSWIGSEYDFWDGLFTWIRDFKFTDLALKLAAVGLPMYIVSYFISTKLYLKGVDRMEK